MGRNAGSTLIVALLSLPPRPLEPIGISSTNFRLRRHFRRPGTSGAGCPESSISSLFKPFRPRRDAVFASTRNDRKRARDLNLLVSDSLPPSLPFSRTLWSIRPIIPSCAFHRRIPRHLSHRRIFRSVTTARGEEGLVSEGKFFVTSLSANSRGTKAENLGAFANATA